MSSTGKTGASKRSGRARTLQVSELLPDVLANVLARRSGMSMDLLAGWEDIVGPDFADCTQPEKITWPRRIDDDDPFKPGTLIVACDGPKALFFQHQVTQTLERVNHFFGFEAVEKIRLVQKPVQQPKKEPKKRVTLSEHDKYEISHVLEHIEDEDLRSRLEKFGNGVYSRKYVRK